MELAIDNSNLVAFVANSLFVHASIACVDSARGPRSEIYFNTAQNEKVRDMYPFSCYQHV